MKKKKEGVKELLKWIEKRPSSGKKNNWSSQVDKVAYGRIGRMKRKK